MGIDSQGINRGKCSCSECVEFVRDSGVLCGYCECVPVRHEKVTDPNSRTTNSTQDGQNTENSQLRNNIWNDVSLGWILDPKADYTRMFISSIKGLISVRVDSSEARNMLALLFRTIIMFCYGEL